MIGTILAWLACGCWVVALGPLWLSLRWPRRVNDVPLGGRAWADLPMISILVPARDEAGTVKPAMERLLSLDYPSYEVIAIDDRSQDGTGALMDEVAGADRRCQVVHVADLPPGWLGKNHANMLGARQARGELLLFTDADVHLHPAALQHAVAAMDLFELDHLVLFPAIPQGGFAESVAMSFFGYMYALGTQFPMAPSAWARHAYVGVGAFNLIRRPAYEVIGTHEALRMEVADDLMLGKLVKHKGLRQRALNGVDMVSVKWQTGLWGVVRGLEKNAFAGVRYSVKLCVAVSLILPLWMTLPAVFAVTGPHRLPMAIMAFATWATYGLIAVGNRYSLAVTPMFPLAATLFSYILLRSMVITLRQGGVRWRDTFYPLEDLRRGMIR